MKRLLASPRRRRRLAWGLGILGLAGAIALLIVVIPSKSPPRRATQAQRGLGPPTFTTSQGASPLFGPPSAAMRRVQNKAIATVQPLQRTLFDALEQRRHLDRAYALLAPGLQARFSLASWQAGSKLPVQIDPSSSASGSSVAFADATTVGLVIAYTSAGGTSPLYAVRFRKLRGNWRVDYLHQGHSSSYVNEDNYAPAGFLPGSTPAGGASWLILLAALAGVVLIVVLVERLLNRSRTARRAFHVPRRRRSDAERAADP